MSLRICAFGWTVSLLLAAAGLSPAADQTTDQAAAEDTARAERLFAHRVLPLLKARCFACHGDDPDDVRGEYNMLTRSGLLRGGESEEPAVLPGRPDDSPLVQAIEWNGLEMPPKENDRLTVAQIGEVRSWIAGGAPWPDAERIAHLLKTTKNEWDAAGGVTVATSGGLKAEWTNRRYDPANLWAYRPLWRDAAGLLAEDDHPIDVLIEDRLQQLQLPAAPPADRRTLIRRATFDLLGLPPTPAEIDAFVADPRPLQEAFADIVERLLASPHYGEQWGRHWLDVVRYADSSGYANDYERGNAWRYRDYVVRAFNDDKPYTQFIREQIAGDEIDPQDAEKLIAVGFLRMGPWELTGMEVAKVARQRFLDDVTDAVGQVFLAHMLQCARCHDHKFDPIPTRDYYAVQAVFATTQLVERRAPFLPVENLAGFAERKYLEQRQQFYEQTLRELNAKRTVRAAREWLAEQGHDAAVFEQVVAELQREKPAAEPQLNDVRRLLAERGVDPATIPPRHIGFEPRDFGLERIARKGLERLAWELERYEPYAISVYNGHTPQRNRVNQPLRMPRNRHAGELERTAILAGGDPFSPTVAVPPAPLSVVAALAESPALPIRIPAQLEGRRTALADWIAAADNPLTARVLVNRVWQWHFGQPLAGNPNNFGATGKKPTDSRLLDHLAARFVQDGWSVKSLHRLIMSSQAYQRSTRHPAPQLLAEKDPSATSYARFLPRRLDAEELRDAMLRISGELNPEIGGIPVRPEMNLEAALQPRQVMGSFASAWQPSTTPDRRHRRSLYALRLRGLRDPFLEVFNAPSPDLSCEAREASTITPQVFAMFNSEISFDRALALANRLVELELDPEATIQRLFQLAYGRPASTDEQRDCVAHWNAMTRRHQSLQFAPPSYPRQVVREAVEENTGEKFSFVEPLEAYAEFEPDLKPHAASPRVRGLAEVCLVLLNANEFAYVY